MSPWRGDPNIACLAPAGGRPLQASSLDAVVTELRERGYRSVLTAALTVNEQDTFLAAGFRVHEELHLLRHDLDAVPTLSSVRLRRGRRSDVRAVLDVDNLAFDRFWRFDSLGLADARCATPTSRFRVAEHQVPVAGYAVCGRAATTGYLQRLAVHPSLQGRGIGSSLVVDALRWSRRRGARSVMVNTQSDNSRALVLYERLGFVRELQGLAVLELNLQWP